MQPNNRISQYYDIQTMEQFYDLNESWEQKETNPTKDLQSLSSFWLFVFLVFMTGLLVGVIIK